MKSTKSWDLNNLIFRGTYLHFNSITVTSISFNLIFSNLKWFVRIFLLKVHPLNFIKMTRHFKFYLRIINLSILNILLSPWITKRFVNKNVYFRTKKYRSMVRQRMVGKTTTLPIFVICRLSHWTEFTLL